MGVGGGLPGTTSESNSAPLSTVAQVALLVTCGVFSLQSAGHWLRGFCAAPSERAAQHELLSGAATAVCALLYLAMYCNVSQTLVLVGGGQFRPFFHLLYVERMLAPNICLVNLAALARERRPPMLALGAVWSCGPCGALYLGSFVPPGAKRLAFLGAAVLCLVPLAATLLVTMGWRLQRSPLMQVYRFLASWTVFCGASYCIVFLFCAVSNLLDTETEVLVYALLDYSTVGVFSFAIGCSLQDVQIGLLPAQEAELSLYPGPHTHGFFPNPSFYDDNI